MKRLKTLSELTEGMNDFEKFMFFRRKADDLDRVADDRRVLRMYGGIDDDAIRKRMRVSSKRWYSYMSGSMPLPWNFLYKFWDLFSEEIKEARHQKNIKLIEDDFALIRRSRPFKIEKQEHNATADSSTSNMAV